MKELDYLLRYGSELFALLPTFKELQLRFPHEEGCSGGGTLVPINELINVLTNDPRVGSVGVRSYFLQCGECHAKKEYRIDSPESYRSESSSMSSNGDW